MGFRRASIRGPTDPASQKVCVGFKQALRPHRPRIPRRAWASDRPVKTPQTPHPNARVGFRQASTRPHCTPLRGPTGPASQGARGVQTGHVQPAQFKRPGHGASASGVSVVPKRQCLLRGTGDALVEAHSALRGPTDPACQGARGVQTGLQEAAQAPHPKARVGTLGMRLWGLLDDWLDRTRALGCGVCGGS